MPAELIVYLIAAFIGALVAGLAGFAFGLIASAIWLHVITPAQSAPLIAAFAIVIQGGTLWKLRHAIDIQRLMPFLVGAVFGIPLGAEVVRWATSAQMRSFIGVASCSSASTAWCDRNFRSSEAAGSPMGSSISVRQSPAKMVGLTRQQPLWKTCLFRTVYRCGSFAQGL